MGILEVQDVNQLVRSLAKYGKVQTEHIGTGFYHLGLATPHEDECIKIINEWKSHHPRAYIHQDYYEIDDDVAIYRFVLSNQ